MAERYGFYKDKNKLGYIAVDTGETFVKEIAGSVWSDEHAVRLTVRANNGLRLEGDGWRARLARQVLGIEDD